MAMVRALLTGRRLVATIVVILGAIFLSSLGFWQLSRHNQRAALNERITARMSAEPMALTGETIDPEQWDYRRVTIRGTFDPDQEVVLRNRSYGGITGVHVLTPLRLEGTDDAVLVDRGWLPMEESAPEARVSYAPQPGVVTIEGVARRSQHDLRGPTDPPLAPGETRLDAWFRVDVPRIEQQTGYRLLPVFVEQQPGPNDAPLPRRTATTDLGFGSHLGYAVQWFSFAVILLVTYLVLIYQQLQRERLDTGPAEAQRAPEAR